MSPSVSVRLLLTQSDARLVALARAGHERAFEALVERYRRPLLGYCRRLLLAHERAEDALQQGLMQAWLALRDGTEVRDVKPWLYRVVHNAALNTRRSANNQAQLGAALSLTAPPSEDLDGRLAARETLADLAALPEMQREALVRTAVGGYTYEEAATTLGLSEGAVRGLVHRARATLRASTTAITPSPLLSWALGSGGADAPLAGRLAAGAGAGSAGLVAGLLKVTATAVTAGVVVVGGVGVSRDTQHHAGRPRRHGRVHSASGASSLVASTAAANHELALAGRGAGASPGRAVHATPRGMGPGGMSPRGMGPGGKPVSRVVAPRRSFAFRTPRRSRPISSAGHTKERGVTIAPAAPAAPPLALPPPPAEAPPTHPGDGGGVQPPGNGGAQGDGEHRQWSGPSGGAPTGQHGSREDSPDGHQTADGGHDASPDSSSTQSAGESESEGGQSSARPDGRDQGPSTGSARPDGRDQGPGPSTGSAERRRETGQRTGTTANPTRSTGERGTTTNPTRSTGEQGTTTADSSEPASGERNYGR